MKIKEKFSNVKAAVEKKAAQFKEQANIKTQQALQWCCDNKETIESAIVVGTAVTGATIKVVRTVNRLRDEKRAIDNRKSYYDHSLQKRVKFKRMPTQYELEEARSRHAVDHEDYYTIYKDLDLL